MKTTNIYYMGKRADFLTPTELLGALVQLYEAYIEQGQRLREISDLVLTRRAA